LRIGVLSPSYPPNVEPCGVGDFTQRLVPELSRAGVEAVILTGLDYRGAERSGGAKVVRVARRWTPGALRRVALLAREEGLHALLVQYVPGLYPPGARWIWVLPLAMRALSPGIPAVLSMHTVGVSSAGSVLRAGALIASAHAILSTNEEVTRLIGRYMRPALGKTREIPIGANVEPPPGGAAAREEARRRVRQEAGLGPGDAVIAHFGLYYPGKGAEEVLQAAAALRAEGRRFRLFMVGGGRVGDEGYLASLKERGRALGLGDEVVWTGYLPPERASGILLGADLFLAPYAGGISSRRGSLMAALAHGLAVVSTPSRIPTRHFREGENFASVPFGDAGALAGAVSALLDDPARRERLAAGARELAARFAWPAIARETRDFLLSVLRRQP